MYDANDIINIRLGRCEESGNIIIEIEYEFPIDPRCPEKKLKKNRAGNGKRKKFPGRKRKGV